MKSWLHAIDLQGGVYEQHVYTKAICPLSVSLSFKHVSNGVNWKPYIITNRQQIPTPPTTYSKGPKLHSNEVWLDLHSKWRRWVWQLTFYKQRNGWNITTTRRTGSAGSKRNSQCLLSCRTDVCANRYMVIFSQVTLRRCTYLHYIGPNDVL
jgi:hypothetical protein